MTELIKITKTDAKPLRQRIDISLNRVTDLQRITLEALRLDADQDSDDIHKVFIDGREVDWIWKYHGASAALEHYAPGHWVDDRQDDETSEDILFAIAHLVDFDQQEVDRRLADPTPAFRMQVLNKVKELWPDAFDPENGGIFWNGIRIKWKGAAA